MTSFLFKTTIRLVLKQIENPKQTVFYFFDGCLTLRVQMMTSYSAFVGESALCGIIFRTWS